MQKDVRNLWSNFNFDDRKEELYEKEQRFLELDDILFSYITSIFDVDFLLTYFNCTESYTDTVVDKDKLGAVIKICDKILDGEELSQEEKDIVGGDKFITNKDKVVMVKVECMRIWALTNFNTHTVDKNSITFNWISGNSCKNLK